ncbi:hypothetical protein ACLOAU_14435 [Niabella sp. CJ426]|uniref:hypothetical protein n=1 Tax=Niabella sp. CJ426 TaxID=3393740 RepID=UPI003CFC053F
MIQPDQLKAILNTIEGTDYASKSSIDLLMEYGFQLKQWMAFSGEQMSIAKEELHRKKRQAMINLVASLDAQKIRLSPLLQKEYVNDCCHIEHGVYELADRCNKACSHSINLVITCISALKEEMKLSQVLS